MESWTRPGEEFVHLYSSRYLEKTRLTPIVLIWQEYLSPSAEKQRNTQVEASTRATFHSLARDYDLSRCESNVQADPGTLPRRR